MRENGDEPKPGGTDEGTALSPLGPESSLETALSEHRAVRRRNILRAIGGVAALGAAGTLGTFLFLGHKKRVAKELAPVRARAAEAAVLAGNFVEGKKLALEARELDPLSRTARLAYFRVGAFDLVDGDGDANASVALLAEARHLGESGLDIALVSLASGVGIKNDRLVEKILKEPRPEDVDLTSDGFYAFVAGAGFDLDCDRAAIEWYELATGLLKDSFLATIRLARSLIFAGELERASKVVELVPAERNEHAILATLLERASALEGESPARTAPPIDRGRIGDLPRSLRVLATALALEDPDQPWGQSAGLDAALDDLDTPLAAILAGRIALAGGDRVSARTASQAALRMRDELDAARSFAARVAFADGDVSQARSFIGDTSSQEGDKDLATTLEAIDAYEACDMDKLDAIAAKTAKTSKHGWKLFDAAIAAGAPTFAYPGRGGPKVVSKFVKRDVLLPAAMDPLIKSGEPWADLVAIDGALKRDDAAYAKKIVASWTNSPLTPAQKARKSAVERATPHP